MMRARWLTTKAARSLERGRAKGATRPPPLPGVPWDLVQDAIGVKATEILAGILRLLMVHTQDAMRAQASGSTGESGGLPPAPHPDAMGRQRARWQREAVDLEH